MPMQTTTTATTTTTTMTTTTTTTTATTTTTTTTYAVLAASTFRGPTAPTSSPTESSSPTPRAGAPLCRSAPISLAPSGP